MNLAGVERLEAEAIYDSGRVACVEFILQLAARVGQHEERLARLEAKELARKEGERRTAGGQSGYRGAGLRTQARGSG